MSQNLISIAFSAEEIALIQTHLQGLVGVLQPKTIALDVQKRRELYKMGGKSERFCRETIDALDRNRQVVPPSLGLDEGLADQRALDVVRPVVDTLEQLLERLRDTEMALGSDVMDTAVAGYALLKLMGKNQGLDGLTKELGLRFSRSSRQAGDAEPVPAPHPIPTAALVE